MTLSLSPCSTHAAMLIPQLTGADFAPLLPAIILAVGAMLLILSEVFLSGSHRSHQPVIAFVAAVLAGIASFSLVFEPARPVLLGFGALDPFGSGLSFVVSVSVALAVLLSSGFLRHRNAERGEFYGLMLFAGAGMSLLAISAELVTLFINLEVLSIATYALASYLRRGPRPAEAGFKYFILGAFAAAIFLYGSALLYGATGTTKLSEIGAGLKTAMSSPGNAWLVYAGVALLAAGFAFKVAAIPFHQWTPDVYEGAPTPITALMSAGVKAAAFVAMVRVFLQLSPSLDASVPYLIFAALALLTMVGGNLLALPQRNVKRMLAYSSIAHAGYLLLAVAALFARPSSEATGVLAVTPLLGGGGGGDQGAVLQGILFYLLGYAVSAIGAFGTIAALERREDEERGTAWDLERFAGLAQRRPGWAIAMTAFMLSLGGVPPTIGFVGKLLLFRAAVDAGMISLCVVGVLASAAGMYYYLRVVVYMFMRPAAAGVAAPERHWPTETALALSCAAVLVLGVAPSLLSEWLAKASVILAP